MEHHVKLWHAGYLRTIKISWKPPCCCLMLKPTQLPTMSESSLIKESQENRLFLLAREKFCSAKLDNGGVCSYIGYWETFTKNLPSKFLVHYHPVFLIYIFSLNYFPKLSMCKAEIYIERSNCQCQIPCSFCFLIQIFIW